MTDIVDPEYPDLIGVVGGPLMPCKVVEIVETMAPTVRVEGRDGMNATYEQTRQYVIRYQAAPAIDAAPPRPLNLADIAAAVPVIANAGISALEPFAEMPDERASTVPADLDAAIRARLDSWGDDPCGYATCVVVGWDGMRGALLAVLDLHEPIEEIHEVVCKDCNGWSGVTARYPCPTVRAIAEKLGVEVDRG